MEEDDNTKNLYRDITMKDLYNVFMLGGMIGCVVGMVMFTIITNIFTILFK